MGFVNVGGGTVNNVFLIFGSIFFLCLISVFVGLKVFEGVCWVSVDGVGGVGGVGGGGGR